MIENSPNMDQDIHQVAQAKLLEAGRLLERAEILEGFRKDQIMQAAKLDLMERRNSDMTLCVVLQGRNMFDFSALSEASLDVEGVVLTAMNEGINKMIVLLRNTAEEIAKAAVAPIIEREGAESNFHQ